ncbi:MAG TPA: hypothetical protein VG965_02155 [Patescibacteria group bacterium]|nr:hypothetical protein [Patescibacteria group bacterium]
MQEHESPRQNSQEANTSQTQYAAVPTHLDSGARQIAQELESEGLNVRLTPLTKNNDKLGLIPKMAGRARAYLVQGDSEGVSAFTKVLTGAKEQMDKHPKATKTAAAIAFAVIAGKLIEKRRLGPTPDRSKE